MHVANGSPEPVRAGNTLIFPDFLLRHRIHPERRALVPKVIDENAGGQLRDFDGFSMGIEAQVRSTRRVQVVSEHPLACFITLVGKHSPIS